MSDQRRSSPSPSSKPLKFRRHSRSHSHGHGRHHHHHHGHHDHDTSLSPRPSTRPRSHPQGQGQRQGQQGSQFEMSGISIHLDSPQGSGSNDLFINVFDGTLTGKDGHTSVAIYSSSNPALHPGERTLTTASNMFPGFPHHPDPPLSSKEPRIKSVEACDGISQTGNFNPFIPEKSDILRSIPTESPHHGVDTQEVANDTSDLSRIMTTTPFILNFRHYNDTEFSLHVGLRRKNKLPFSNPSSFIPPTTDDYNREIFGYLKAQPNLKSLKLVLEVHSEDDILTYKTFDDVGSKGVGVKSGGGGSGHFASMENLPGNEFPVILSNTGSFWKSGTISTGLNFIHIELPGLSSIYLKDWKRFIELQFGLGTIICNFGAVHWTFYEKAVKHNEKTLEKVVLRRVISYDVKNQIHIPLDFAMFANCARLSYLKITGGGYKERLGGCGNFRMSMSGEELPQQEMLLHTNFGAIPVENLAEFHFSKMTISRKLLQELAIAGQDKKLELICADCPDLEYYDGDWQIYCENPDHESEQAYNTKIAVMYGGYPSSRKTVEYYRKRQSQKSCLIIFLLILCLIAIVGMTVAIAVAISYSNEGRRE